MERCGKTQVRVANGKTLGTGKSSAGVGKIADWGGTQVTGLGSINRYKRSKRKQEGKQNTEKPQEENKENTHTLNYMTG